MSEEKEKKSVWSTILPTAIVVVLLVIGGIIVSKKDKQITAMHNMIAQQSELVRYNESLFSDVSFLTNRITKMDNELDRTIKEVLYHTRLTAKIRDLIISTISDTVIKTPIGLKYPIYWSGQGAILNGAFIPDSKLFEAVMKFDPIGLKLWAMQDKEGIWKTVVETSNKYVSIDSIYSEISPFKSPLKNNFFVMGGIFGGKGSDGLRLGGRIGMGYKYYGLGIGMDNYGFMFEAMYIRRF